jgi:hypothetical protein
MNDRRVVRSRSMLRGGWSAWLWPAGLLVLASDALAAGGKPAPKLVNVADTRLAGAGAARWIGDVYNSSMWLYGLLVVVVMVGMGVVLGFGVDRLMGLVGIDLGKIEHHE